MSCCERDRGDGSYRAAHHLDSYNYDALAAYVLRPLRADGDGRYRPRSYDLATDTEVRPPPRQAPQDALVVVEGMFLHRDGLTEVWDYSVNSDPDRPYAIAPERAGAAR